MQATHPHFLLFSEASSAGHAARDQWRFVLQSLDQNRIFCASDQEPDAAGERLELLAVVRGLEALPEPSRVTLVTKSRYVSEGITRGLEEWRDNDWKWERFGKLVSVRDCDLWQRINRALEFHQIECRAWRFNLATSPGSESEPGRQLVGQQTTAPTEAVSVDAAPAESRPEIRSPVAARVGVPEPKSDGWISRTDRVYATTQETHQRKNFGLTAALSAPMQRISKWFQKSRPDPNWAGA